MCIRYFGFFLLICFPGVLHGNAQSAALSCSAPKLDDGYFVPEGDAYAHETKLVYACDEGYKPVVDGWWAESTCQNGKWSHEPLCIDENACFMPDIRNGKHKQEEKGWYADGSVMEITCDKGYEIKRRNATPTCRNGKWISESVCKKSRQACGEPPKVSHAVVINQGYQDVFAEDSEVQYECEDGFTAETDTKTIICRAGTWTAAPTCSRERIYSTTSKSVHSFLLFFPSHIRLIFQLVRIFEQVILEGKYFRSSCVFSSIAEQLIKQLNGLWLSSLSE
ncbi:hypothetical protein PAMA_005311 [Pampus argenteus]